MLQLRRRPGPRTDAAADPAPKRVVERTAEPIEAIAIPAGDPLETVLLSAGAPVALREIGAHSQTIRRLRESGVELVVPLIGQGELLGALYLGARLSDQPYSSDDRRLLGNLASQVAPAMRVAQLVREQQAEAKERERIQQELRVAALIQQTLLPKELPSIRGWHVDAFYRPARAVGGDFYDFIDLGEGRLGVVIGDVTDKGVPAALVMATSRSMLRAAAQKHLSPSAVLAEVNDNLVAEIPPAMFVTCLYAIIDTGLGDIVLANAGHNLPYVGGQSGVVELRATGMPLGLMPGMSYEEKRYRLGNDEVMVLTSDGITEAHNTAGEMYGFSRLMGQVGKKRTSDILTDLIGDVERWVGDEAEQEDDITLVVVRRTSSARTSAEAFTEPVETHVTSFTVPSVEGNERLAMDRVAEAVTSLDMAPQKVERLKTAVAETVMNAIEHGNGYDSGLEVEVDVAVTDVSVVVTVTDHGGDGEVSEPETPDIEAKLAGTQTPRGWGLFLVSQMADEVHSSTQEGRHTVTLRFDRRGGRDAG